MNRKFTFIIALQALLIITLFWVLVFYGKDEYESYNLNSSKNIESPALIKNEQGINVVILPLKVQQNSGITISKLEASQHKGSMTSYGTVASINSLLDLRLRYQAAKAEASVTRASAANYNAEYQRLKALNADDKNVSDRAVTAAEAAIKSDQARLLASESAANNIQDTMRQQWGDVLTKLAIQEAINKPLLQENEVLIQILLPFNAPEPKPNSHLLISVADSANNKAIVAVFVSRAPSIDTTLQGKTYFYRASDNALRVGMRVQTSSLYAQTSDGKSSSGTLNKGVIVPNSAVVWYGGKAWVYLQQGTNRFVRKPIVTDTELDNGWFNQGTLKPNDIIVTNGAQLLLSEEFKSEIKNENED